MIKLTDKEFITLTTFVHEKYGINLAKKRILIEGRLSNTLREKNLNSFQEYMDILFKDTTGAEMTNLLNKLTTNHTYFMREVEHFDYMLNTVLPYFEKTVPSKVLRIWSAACSSGQEPYTMAMALDEYFGNRKSQWDTVILATDISMNALEKAKKAIYPADSLNEIPERWRKKYFVDKKDGTFEVCDRLKKEVIFKPFNLMDPFTTFHKPFDLIFCRNVMIYFDEATKEALINKFYQYTAPGGFLFIGHSEVINRASTHYKYIKPAIYQREVKNCAGSAQNSSTHR